MRLPLLASCSLGLLITSLILVRISIPFNPLESGDWLRNNARVVGIALSLIPLSGVAFLWFMGVVRDRFGEMEDRFFATVFLGSGFLFLVLMFISAGIAGSVILLYGNSLGNLAQDEFYPFSRALMYTITNVYAVKMASVFMISTTTLSFRIGAFPKWVIYLSYGLGSDHASQFIPGGMADHDLPSLGSDSQHHRSGGELSEPKKRLAHTPVS